LKGITLFTIISLITSFPSLSHAYSERKSYAYSEKVFNDNKCLNNEVVNSWKNLIKRLKDQDDETKIREVNNFFNHNIKHQDDIDNWGTKDNWATPFETMIQGAGDCEDYATAKYKTLRLLNIPDKSLKLHYVKAKQGRSSITIPHMILTYQDKNQDEIVLDNLVPSLTPLKERIDLIPIFAFNNSHIWANNTKYGQDPQERIYHWKAFMERYEKQAFTCLVE
jgi:predicted transglutaminase-like cysteine proteinase